MLNKIKIQVSEMLDTMAEAINYLPSLKAEEQGSFIADIGAMIDSIDKILSSGERYTEIISHGESLKNALADHTNPGGWENLCKIYDTYAETLDAVPVRYKVVFLPYYSSTWDSLESVYRAFEADPLFVTEVVIMPVLRNTPTGYTHIYEDYLTPIIPNTHYDNYDFETDLPDIVFWSQPYDESNYPKFQSQNIKKYTKLLVYIPYYLYIRYEYEKENLSKVVDEVSHLSGHKNMDIFVAPGPAYIKDFRMSRNIKKMVALGNPKLDYIFKHRKFYPKYPDWDKITAGKTVFMLNIHYMAQNDYYQFQKEMEYILSIIEETEDAALIWRPHPLSFNMINVESENNPVKQSWNKLVNCVRSSPNMILDRTPGYISSVMYSDAVLSMQSSLIPAAVFMDKPVFVLQSKVMNVYASCREKKKASPFDKNNLFISSVCVMGSFDPDKQKLALERFMEDIIKGIDTKKDLRKAYNEQNYVNLDGNCGKAVCEYIKANYV